LASPSEAGLEEQDEFGPTGSDAAGKNLRCIVGIDSGSSAEITFVGSRRKSTRSSLLSSRSS